MKNICNNCIYFVTQGINTYSHDVAKKTKEGFCLHEDLFTEVKPYELACKRFVDDNEDLKQDLWEALQ